MMSTLNGLVALRKESVDRNCGVRPWLAGLSRSLSARRAWIEIIRHGVKGSFQRVALRKESVDRNMSIGDFAATAVKVALRKESVDRNIQLFVLY